jgi:DNA invertase Pin-like site-specific DNA recombinase
MSALKIADTARLEGWLSNHRELQALQCNLYLHQQAIDTTTPSGKAMFQMCGVFAEFERAMIVERVNSGLARAKAKGVKLGRGNKKDGERSADEKRWGMTRTELEKRILRLQGRHGYGEDCQDAWHRHWHGAAGCDGAAAPFRRRRR